MGCDRVVVTKTDSKDGKTTVNWLKYTMTDLTGFIIYLVQEHRRIIGEANPWDDSYILPFSLGPPCQVTVTPKGARGRPVDEKASFAAPLPFPPSSSNPERPIVLRVCADDTTVTVNWVASKLPDLEGNYVTIVKGSERLTNFPVEGPKVVAYTAEYKCEPGFSYEVFVTPYDWAGPGPASYPVKIQYP